ALRRRRLERQHRLEVVEQDPADREAAAAPVRVAAAQNGQLEEQEVVELQPPAGGPQGLFVAGEVSLAPGGVEGDQPMTLEEAALQVVGQGWQGVEQSPYRAPEVGLAQPLGGRVDADDATERQRLAVVIDLEAADREAQRGAGALDLA